MARNEKGQFVKGESGNPKGKPEGSVSLLNELKKQLRTGGKAEEIVAATIRDALAGDAAARKLVWDRIEGPVTEKMDLTSDGKPFKALISVDLDKI